MHELLLELVTSELFTFYLSYSSNNLINGTSYKMSHNFENRSLQLVL